MFDARQIVLDMYAAFAKGDIPTLLAGCSPDVRWEDNPGNSAQDAGVPWMLPRRGREGVAQFFQLLSAYKFHQFDVKGVMGYENRAVGLVKCKLESPTGGVFEDEEMHLFEFDDAGMLIRMRHFVDTAKAIAASKPQAAKAA